MDLRKLIGGSSKSAPRLEREWQGMAVGNRVKVANQKHQMFGKTGKIVSYNHPKVKVRFGKAPLAVTKEFNARELELIKDWEVQQ